MASNVRFLLQSVHTERLALLAAIYFFLSCHLAAAFCSGKTRPDCTYMQNGNGKWKHHISDRCLLKKISRLCLSVCLTPATISFISTDPHHYCLRRFGEQASDPVGESLESAERHFVILCHNTTQSTLLGQFNVNNLLEGRIDVLCRCVYSSVCMCACLYVHVSVCMCVQEKERLRDRVCACICVWECLKTYIVFMCFSCHLRTKTHPCTHKHTYKNAHTHTHTHTRTHAHTQMQTHT